MRASQHPPQPLPLPLPPPPLSLPRTPQPLSAPSPATSPRSSSASTSLVPFSWERHPGVPKASFRDTTASPAGAAAPLPLPPPLGPAPRRRRRRRASSASVSVAAASSSSSSSGDPAGSTSADPFVAAFAECTRDGDGTDRRGADADADVAVPGKQLWLARTAKKSAAASGRAERSRWWLAAGGGFVGFLDLYGCKSAMAVADGAFLARRPAGVAHAHGRRASAGR